MTRMRNAFLRVAGQVALAISSAAVASAYPGDPDALLGSSRGGSAAWAACIGQPDAGAARSALAGPPGGEPGQGGSLQRVLEELSHRSRGRGRGWPCADLWRAARALRAWRRPPRDHRSGAAALFPGTDPNTLESAFGLSTFTAEQYDDLWRVWRGFLVRPDNFDELAAERYGAGFGPTPNPYPRPWGNPNRTDGGTGRLPEISPSCATPTGAGAAASASPVTPATAAWWEVHRTGRGSGVTVGGGSSLADLDLFLRDMLPLGYPASIATLLNLNRTRGTNNASPINLAFLFPDEEPLPRDVALDVLLSGSTRCSSRSSPGCMRPWRWPGTSSSRRR